MLPMTMVQIFSTNTYAQSDEEATSEKPDSKVIAYIDRQNATKKNAEVLSKKIQVKSNALPSPRIKKVRLVKGKRNTQQMNFLSVFLLLKEGKR